MAILRTKEIMQMNAEQQKEKLNELKEELMKMNTQKSVGKNIKNPGRMREIKKTIARLLTLQKKQEVRKKE